MAKKPIQYAVVDAFAAGPFRGNPAAVCLLEAAADERWMQSVAAEFNLSETAFLLRDPSAAAAAPRFQLRWFTPTAEVDLCGHATLASVHFLFTSVFAEQDAVVEFTTKSGLLTAKKVPGPASTGASGEGKLFIELDFPMIDRSARVPSCRAALHPRDPERSFRRQRSQVGGRWSFPQEKRSSMSIPTSVNLRDVQAPELLLQDQHLLDLVMTSSHVTSLPISA